MLLSSVKIGGSSGSRWRRCSPSCSSSSRLSRPRSWAIHILHSRRRRASLPTMAGNLQVARSSERQDWADAAGSRQPALT